MVIDGHRHGQVVSFAFVKRESEDYVRRIFEALLAGNSESCGKVKVVVTDKDFVEQQVVKSVLPDVSLQLCIFHVLRAFNRGVAECNLSSQQRSQVCSIFEQLVYADSETEFSELLQQLHAFPTVFGYYNRCWAGCKGEWAACCTKHRPTFGIRTNNFVESMNQKIKFLLHRNTTFYDCIEKLLKLFAFKQQELDQRIAEAAGKKTVIYQSQLPAEFCSKLTPPAVKEVNRQLEKASKWVQDNVSFEWRDGGMMINGKEYAVNDVSCSCSFYAAFTLTCAHLFFIRMKTNRPLYADGDIQHTNRWSVEFAVQDGYIPKQASHVTVVTGTGRARSKTEKFRHAMALLKPLADELSECGDSLFQTYMRCCEDFIKCIKNKRDCCIVFAHSDNVRDSVSSSLDDDFQDSYPVAVSEMSALNCQTDETATVSGTAAENRSTEEDSVQSQATALCGQLQTQIDRLLATSDNADVEALRVGEGLCTTIDNDHYYARREGSVHCDTGRMLDYAVTATSNETCDEMFSMNAAESAEVEVDCVEVEMNSVLLTDYVVLEPSMLPVEQSDVHDTVPLASASTKADDLPTSLPYRKRRRAEEPVTIKKCLIDITNVTGSVESLQECVRGAKAPLPSKCRGRPKGLKKFRCSGAAVTGGTRKPAIMSILAEDVDVDDILNHSKQITIDDIKARLTPMVLQFMWSRHKQFFTESAYVFFCAKLEELRQLVNTCPECKVVYDDSASMVGCDGCGFWFHFSCVGLRRAPPSKRDWYCEECKKL